MKNIDEFLKKFTVIENPLTKKEEVILILKKHFNITLTQEEFEIKKGALILNVHPTIKSHLFMKKDGILEIINTSIKDLNLIKLI